MLSMKFLVTRNVVAAILLDATMPQTHSASSNSSMQYAAHHTNCNCDRAGTPAGDRHREVSGTSSATTRRLTLMLVSTNMAFSSASDAIITSWPVLSALLVTFTPVRSGALSTDSFTPLISDFTESFASWVGLQKRARVRGCGHARLGLMPFCNKLACVGTMTGGKLA